MDRPLQGVRVVEVAMWVAGPSTTAVLGDWGADVIKVEDPTTGDPIRGFVTRTMGDPNARIRPPFELDNRNKRSVAVDLRRPDGHAFALKLIEHAASDLTVGLMTGRSPQSESRSERVNPLWSSYRCADAKWIYFVMIQSDRHWSDFCRVLDKQDWFDDPRFKDSTFRAQNCAALTAEIDRIVATRTSDDWAPIFDRHNLVWAPVRTDAEVLDDPQAHAIGAFARVDHPNIPGCRVVNSPIEFGDAEKPPHRAAPELGQHTEEIALEMGLTWDDIARLKTSGTLG